LEQVINKLKAELLKTLPGQEIQYKMAPTGRLRYNPVQSAGFTYKPSAVMILFCIDRQDRWFLPLTQRFTYNGAHSGQISLPGGKAEAGDLSLKDTALRECYEEIGIKEEVDVLGSLTNLYIPVSGYLVEPFVGICKIRDPLFIPHEREVKKIIKLYTSDLVNNNSIKNGVIQLEGKEPLGIETPYFGIEEHKIWGATAMILNELKEIIRTIF
jgi:8-oxo-dGTP pyrophosphatase MutT (NUDIX family)